MSTNPPDIATLQPLTPPSLERLVKTCLAKDPEARWQSAHDVKLELTWMETGVGPTAAVSKSRHYERLALGVALVLSVAAALLALQYFPHGPQSVQAVRSSLLPPSGHFFQRGNFSISPDGRVSASSPSTRTAITRCGFARSRLAAYSYLTVQGCPSGHRTVAGSASSLTES